MGEHQKIERAGLSLDGADWKRTVDTSTTGIAKKGYLWVCLTLGIFFVWALLFPLSSAIVSSGKLISLGKNKLLQHPTGGVVRNIAVEDGALLKQGQLILEIEPAVAKAEFGRLIARQSLLVAQKNRILASGGGMKSELKFPFAELRGIQSELVQKVSKRATGSLAGVFKGQEDEFNAKTIRIASEYSALQNKLAQQQAEQGGLKTQIGQQSQRLTLLKEQTKKMTPLVENGYVAKTRLWDMQAQVLEVQALNSSLVARSLMLDAAMDETYDLMSQLKASESEGNAKEYSSIVAELEGVNQQVQAAKIALEYSTITAPVAGTLVNLQANTVGGVVEAGAAIGEIVPTNSPLIVEARILPQDIGEVYKSQDAEIIITAFNRRIASPIKGTISYVSADSSLDQNTGESFFIVNVSLGILPKKTPTIQPGMMAEVYIQTGSKSFLSYVMGPISDSFKKAFNER